MRSVDDAPVEKLTIVATMRKSVGGTSHARIINPLHALAEEPGVSAQIVANNVFPNLSPGTAGICILQCPILAGEPGLEVIRHLLTKGYIIVSEFDVNPDVFPVLQAPDVLAFRGVHAVQTSTGRLADVLRSKNPEIAVFLDAMPRLPRIINFSDPERRTLFFGPLNRAQHWEPWLPMLAPMLNAAAASVGDRLKFSIVHDRALFDALDTPHKSFVPACDYETYLQLLGQSELAFMPLADTAFNRTKSDLEFVEASAHRVAALASPIAYGATIEDTRTGLLFVTPEELLYRLVWLVVNPGAVAIADAARMWVAEHRMLASQTKARIAWYHSLVARRTELTNALLARVPELVGQRNDLVTIPKGIEDIFRSEETIASSLHVGCPQAAIDPLATDLPRSTNHVEVSCTTTLECAQSFSQGRALSDLFLNFPDFNKELLELAESRQYEQCLDLIARAVNSIYRLAQYHGRALYLETFDTILAMISDRLIVENNIAFPTARSRQVLIVASEIYIEGGHSRVIEDICRCVGKATVILTDPFGSLSHPVVSFIAARLGSTSFSILPNMTMVDKTLRLIRICIEISPSCIIFLTHHQDSIAYAALAGSKVPYKRIYHHHTDHNPSLGATQPEFLHVDCTNLLRECCQRNLQRKTFYLPLYVPDQGMRAGQSVARDTVSSVTSGTCVKFALDGELAYSRIVNTILKAVKDNHYHIGHLPDAWIEEIRATLCHHSIDPERFVYLGAVPSLWKTLQQLDASVYVASAPNGGGRAAIEAQGCGYPVIYYFGEDTLPLTAAEELYGLKQLRWSNIEEFGDVLRLALPSHQEFGKIARMHYEANYAEQDFCEALRQLI